MYAGIPRRLILALRNSGLRESEGMKEGGGGPRVLPRDVCAGERCCVACSHSRRLVGGTYAGSKRVKSALLLHRVSRQTG